MKDNFDQIVGIIEDQAARIRQSTTEWCKNTEENKKLKKENKKLTQDIEVKHNMIEMQKWRSRC